MKRVQKLEVEYLRNEDLRPWKRLLLGGHFVSKTAIDSDVMNRSAALSYTVVFSLIPLVTTTLAFLTAFPGLQAERERLMDMLSAQLLPGAVQGVKSYIGQFSTRAAAAGTVSSLVFFVTVLMLFQTMESAFNGIWQVKVARTWVGRLRTLALFLIVGAIGTALFFAAQQQASELSQRFKLEPAGVGGLSILVEVGSLLVAWALFALANRVLPNTRVSWRAAVIGGLVAGTLWHFLKAGFTWYIEEVASYKSIYGTLGTIPIFFLWVYLSFLLLLLGGTISFVAQNLKHLILQGQIESNTYPRGFYAVMVAAVLARAFHYKEGPLSERQIAERLELPAYYVANALAELGKSGIVLAAVEDNEFRYILRHPDESITVQQIVISVAGDALQIPRTPQTDRASPIQKRVELVFREAQARGLNPLERTTIADIASDGTRRAAS